MISELWIIFGKAIKMANDIMIDIESLDTSPNCVILTIGAVRFDPKGMGVIEKLELRPMIEEQTEKFNRVINEDTLRWWSTQSEDAMEEAMGDRDRISFKDCMEQLYKFCWNRRAVWSNGASFDVVAMESDTRTLYEIAGVSLKDKKYGTSTTHKAVEDAEHQAIVVQDAYRNLIKAGLVK
jgi:hypothetical protein